MLDIVRCERVDGGWNAMGSGGGTYGNLPLEADPNGRTGLAVESRSAGESDHHRHWSAGGFVLGDVRAVELSVGALTRRVEVGPRPTAFVVAISDFVDDDAEDDEPEAVPVLRCLDGGGQVVDESRPWRPGPPAGRSPSPRP